MRPLTKMIVMIGIIVALVYVLFVILDAPEFWECRDCSDVERTRLASGGSGAFQIEGESPTLINDPQPSGFWHIVGSDDTGFLQQFHFDSLEDLEANMDSLHLSERNEKNLRHIIDCIERKCK